AVAREVKRERARRRACRGILAHTETRTEHSRLPVSSAPGEAADTDFAERLERGAVGCERGDRVLVLQGDVDVARTVAVDLDGELRGAHTERGEQLLRLAI